VSLGPPVENGGKRGVHPLCVRDAVDLVPCKVTHVENLLPIRAKPASGDAAPEYRSHIRGLIAVRVVDDQVRTAIDSENPGQFNNQPGFFPDFAYSTIGGKLSGLDQSSRHHPDVAVGVKPHQHAVLIITNGNGRRRQDEHVVTDFLTEFFEVSG
jgi:hypothetical protein